MAKQVTHAIPLHPVHLTLNQMAAVEVFHYVAAIFIIGIFDKGELKLYVV